MKYSFVHLLILSIISAVWIGCGPEAKDNGTPVITKATDADFGDTATVSIELAEGFEMDLWAPGPLLSNAVAISIDNQGVAYVAETSRRKSSDLDIRDHRDWMIEDLKLQSIEDTDEFHKRKLDPSLSDQNTWQEDFNGDSIHDWRDLTVQTEYIRRIWDSDGDGRADASNVFAQEINSMLTGVAAGILYQDGDVFLTAAPDVYHLKDEDGDGDADSREIISNGYGIHIAYAGHDMSGLTMGPDGRVYWSIGDIGVNVVDKNGKRWAYPNQGAVMRSNPDGSDFEVFAHGLRNPQELAFDKYGNLISVDNDGDHPGEHERYVHIIEGSDTGWRINWQFGKYNEKNEGYKPWMDESLHVPHFPGQAAYLLPPLALAPDGPAGLAYNPGTALSEKWEGYFFGSFFKGSAAQSKIEAFKLAPKGASFEVADSEEIVKGVASTGVTFGPDGSLFINDWKDGYAKKPQGRIWKLDVGQADAHPLRAETMMALQKNMKDMESVELTELMAYSDMRVRMAAQFEFVGREAQDDLLHIANNSTSELAQIHAIWGLGQLARKDKKRGDALAPLLDSTNPEIRAQVAKVLGDAKYETAAEKLIELIADKNARVQFFASEALGKLGARAAFQPLIGLLEKIEETDPHLRHAVVYAISKLGIEDEIVSLKTHPSKFVRIGAVVALRHLLSPKVADFLKDEDPLVAVEAARAIHDDQSIQEALSLLAASLSETTHTEEAFLRRAVNANLRLGGKECAKRLADYSANENAPKDMRADALWALGYWGEPPVLDRVEGRYRELPARQIAEAHEAISPHFAQLLGSNDNTILASIIEAAGRVNYKIVGDDMFNKLSAKGIDANVKNAIVGALAALKSEHLVPALNTSLEDKSVEVRTFAQRLLTAADLPAENVVKMLDKVLKIGTIEEQQTALESLGNTEGKEAEVLLSNWMDQLKDGSVAEALQLDVLLAAEKHGADNLMTKMEEYEASKDLDDPISKYRESLYGGNVRRGQRIFARNNSAQCIRCHQVRGFGGDVGPVLTNIASVLSREELLASLVDPNARLAPGYGTVILKLENGEQMVGVEVEETGSILKIREASGDIKEISKKEISERQYAPSGMISMDGVLSKSEIRDVIALLATLK